MKQPRSTTPEAGAPSPARSERRFRTLFEHAPFSVQLLAADGRTLQVNKAWEALWQVADDEGVKSYVLSEYNILFDPQLQAKGITEYLHRAFAGESVTTPPVGYDPAEIGRGGRARWVRGHLHPVQDEAGQVCEVILIHEDVTERMQTEEALRASEMRLKQLANTIPQLAWMADPSGWIHWYNDRWYEYTGATPAEMEGWGWQAVYDPSALPNVLALWKRSLETGEPLQATLHLRGKDGRFRPFFTLAAPLKDHAGKVVQWFGTNTDVSHLQEAEEELRQAEERLRLATDAGGIGIWEWDFVQDKVTWSDRVYQLHGLAPGQLGGKAEDFSRLVHPEDREMVWSKVQAAIQEQSGFSAELRTVLPDGSVRWLSTWARVHKNRSGIADRMVGASISIDAYKKAEAALKESDRRKDEFLAMLGHELRNPLAPISTAAQILKISIGDQSRVREASEIISRQVKHMTELVDDLLDVSRVTRGLVQLDKDNLELNSVIASAVEQVYPLIEARRHHLTTLATVDRIFIYADRTRLVQVIVNLLNNAAKYTPAGGEIELKLEVRGAWVRICVADNGPGIETSLLPHVFELFTQAARTPDRSLGGLGIGLALVRSIVALHGGEVEAYSGGPGSGSTFVVTLPLVGPTPASSQRLVSEQPMNAVKPMHIMIVDDNLDAAQSLASLLELSGHHVTIEKDAYGALNRWQQNPPRVFILDIGLPDLDGYELVKRLREQPALRDAMFIALTGYGQAQDRALSKAAGFHYHFVKPMDPQELANILSRMR